MATSHLPEDIFGGVAPHEVYRRVDEGDRVRWDASAGMWFIADRGLVRELLRDVRCSAAGGQDARAHGVAPPATMLTVDPPEHTRLRTPMRRALLGPLTDHVADSAEAFVAVLLDRIAGARRGDVVADLAGPTSMFTFATLFAIPAEGRAEFKRLVQHSVALLDPFAGADDIARAQDTADALSALLTELAADRWDNPADDLVSRLISHPEDLSPDELIANLTLVIVGGYAPLESAISLALMHLMSEPTLWAHCRSRETTDAVVAELLRVDAPIPFAARVATEPIDLPGERIEAGQTLILLLAAANTDPAEWDDGTTLDPHRSVHPHAAFGDGMHRCIAASLVEQVLGIVVRGVGSRFIEPWALVGPVEWRDSVVPRRPAAMPFQVSAGLSH